jgi:hypothetical protein
MAADTNFQVDDIWALAQAADGKSSFVVNTKQPIEVDFERALGVPPLPPLRG